VLGWPGTSTIGLVICTCMRPLPLLSPAV
jgi:hypothetical protein